MKKRIGFCLVLFLVFCLPFVHQRSVKAFSCWDDMSWELGNCTTYSCRLGDCTCMQCAYTCPYTGETMYCVTMESCGASFPIEGTRCR